jgi:hypothetical protein
METKQTAIEWLVKIYLQTGKIDSFDINQAKAIEKENSEISFFAGYNYEGGHPIDEHEKYYTHTFTEQPKQ